MTAWTARDDAQLVAVVLDDEPEHPDERPPTGAGRTDRQHRRRRRAWSMVALLAVVAVLAGVDARASRVEHEALAASADVPGVLGSLAEPLTELWRLPIRPSTTGLGDRVVTVADGALVGLDAATGERRWSIPLVGNAATCPVGVPGEGTADSPGAVPASLVCFGVGRPENDRGGLAAHVVDVADGEVRTELRGPPRLIAAAPLEGDAVLVGSGPGKLTVSRTELVHGRARWSVDAHGVEPGVADLVVHADSGVVAVESATTIVLDAGDGRTLGRWVAAPGGRAPPRARVVSHPGTGFGVWETRYSGRWYRPDGTPGPVLDGAPLVPEVEDDGTPGIVLLGSRTGDRVRAVDVATGDTVWDRPAPERHLLHLGGRFVVSRGDRLEAWDAATGTVLWTAALDATEVPYLDAPWTDGVRLVVRGADDDGRRLTAFRLADGERIWRSTLPAGTRSVRVVGERLAAVGRLDGRVEGAAVLG